MKIKKGFVSREILGKRLVVPTGELSRKFKSMLKLNKTGGDIWDGVEAGLTEEEIAQKLVGKYKEVDMDTAIECVKKFLVQMEEAGVIEK